MRILTIEGKNEKCIKGKCAQLFMLGPDSVARADFFHFFALTSEFSSYCIISKKM